MEYIVKFKVRAMFSTYIECTSAPMTQYDVSRFIESLNNSNMVLVSVEQVEEEEEIEELTIEEEF